jgi:hypothetical protein
METELEKQKGKIGATEKVAPKVIKSKLSLSEEFEQGLEGADKENFIKLKDVLLNQCGQYEFEVFNEDSLEDIEDILPFMKHGIISIEEDGVVVKLRKSISVADIKTESLKILYERNEALERTYTRKIKVKKGDLESQKDYSKGLLAASLDKIENKMLGVEHVNKIHKKDYDLLLNCYNFFR